MIYDLKCRTYSGVKVHYSVANGPIFNLIDDKAKECIGGAREVVVRKDLGNIVLDEDEHRCMTDCMREEELKLVRTGPHAYKVVDDNYLKHHKAKSKRSVISGDDLTKLFSTYNKKPLHKKTAAKKK